MECECGQKMAEVTGWPSLPKALAFDNKRTTGDPKAEATETVYQVGFDQKKSKSLISPNKQGWFLERFPHSYLLLVEKLSVFPNYRILSQILPLAKEIKLTKSPDDELDETVSVLTSVHGLFLLPRIGGSVSASLPDLLSALVKQSRWYPEPNLEKHFGPIYNFPDICLQSSSSRQADVFYSCHLSVFSCASYSGV